MAAKSAIVSWLLNFRIHMFVKSAVKERQEQDILFCTKHTVKQINECML